MSLTCYLSDDKQTITVYVDGVLNISVVDEFFTIFLETSINTYIIDLKDCENIDASGIGLLVNLKRRISDGKTAQIINCQPNIQSLLKVSGITRFMDVA